MYLGGVNAERGSKFKFTPPWCSYPPLPSLGGGLGGCPGTDLSKDRPCQEPTRVDWTKRGSKEVSQSLAPTPFFKKRVCSNPMQALWHDARDPSKNTSEPMGPKCFPKGSMHRPMFAKADPFKSDVGFQVIKQVCRKNIARTDRESRYPPCVFLFSPLWGA